MMKAALFFVSMTYIIPIFSAISSWLLHEGYGRALAAFKKHADQNLDETGDVQMEKGEEESSDMLERRRGCDISVLISRDILRF